MDLRSLKYVSAAIRLQSISKAAAELYIAQPALSRQIRLLEEELGVALLVRHRRGVVPTTEGLKVMEVAEVLQRLARDLRDEMGSQAAEPNGKIRFGFPGGPGGLFLGQVIADFMRKFPKVSFMLREGMTGELGEALMADRLDLAVMLYDGKYQNLQRRPLFAEDVWLAGEPSHWPFVNSPLDIQQLAGLPLVHASGLGTALDKLAARHKLQFRSAIEGDTRTAAKAVVDAGLGFMLMPASAVQQDVAEGRLAGAPVHGLELRRGLFWRADRPLSRAVVEFVGKLERAVTALKLHHGGAIRDIVGAK